METCEECRRDQMRPSASFVEALSRDDAGRPHMPMPGNVGPWDELAEWYWRYLTNFPLSFYICLLSDWCSVLLDVFL